MHRLPIIGLGRRSAQLVVWAMVALAPMQSIAACMLAVLGPAHTHRAAQATVVLDDVRRAAARPVAQPAHIATPFGHFHAGAPQRHQHAVGDPTVVALDDPGQSAVDPADTSASTALAGLGFEPPIVAWLGHAPGDVRASCAAWSLQTHDPEPFERPPRAA